MYKVDKKKKKWGKDQNFAKEERLIQLKEADLMMLWSEPLGTVLS